MNSVSFARFSPETADSRISDVIAWFDARGIPFVWRIGPADSPNDLAARLVRLGFALDPDTMPGMAAPLIDLPAIELPVGASIELVRDAGSFRESLEVLVTGFQMPRAIVEAFMKFADVGFGPPSPSPILARIDGRPVATALALVAGGGVGISNVATLPDVRGQGLGRAITLAAMHLGREANATIALLSTEMGYSVYRRLGFEEFGSYRACVRTRD